MDRGGPLDHFPRNWAETPWQKARMAWTSMTQQLSSGPLGAATSNSRTDASPTLPRVTGTERRLVAMRESGYKWPVARVPGQPSTIFRRGRSRLQPRNRTDAQGPLMQPLDEFVTRSLWEDAGSPFCLAVRLLAKKTCCLLCDTR